MRTVAFTVAVALLVFALLCMQVSAFNEAAIRCKVCDRAIAHIWNQGVELRTHCKTHGTDPRCDISNLHKHGIEEMVKDVCDDLPKTHQALSDSEFELIAHDDPQHEPEIIDAIKKACVRWVHEQHGVEQVTRLMFANLDAGKKTKTILHALQQRFCDAACSAKDADEVDAAGDL